jgi:hypothetical protein
MFGLNCTGWYRKQAVAIQPPAYSTFAGGGGGEGGQHYFAKEPGLADPISTVHMGY